jgi:hypothetical protein
MARLEQNPSNSAHADSTQGGFFLRKKPLNGRAYGVHLLGFRYILKFDQPGPFVSSSHYFDSSSESQSEFMLRATVCADLIPDAG